MSQRNGSSPVAEVAEGGRLARMFPAMESVEYRKLFYSAGLSAVFAVGIDYGAWLAGW